MAEARDKLTGLETHTAFLERVEVALDEAQETETPVSVALADIDFFGKLNEEHGHSVGDEVISAVARHIRDSVGDAGTVYRCGGEEFGVVLPGVDKERAFLLMERIRNDFSTVEKPVEAAFSVGVATRPDDGTRGQDVVRKADEALYRAKLTGRNRVCLARDEKMVTKTSYYTQSQLDRLSTIAKQEGVGEAVILREALDDVIRKYFVREV